MIPFPGESVGLRDAFRLSDPDDFTLYNAIWLREGSAALVAGETWRLYVWDGDTDYLEDTLGDYDISWVVEVLSGSASVVASEGDDLDYGDDPVAVSTPIALGTHTLTPGTNVITSTVTAQHIHGPTPLGAPVLTLECTSGSVEVQQIKMRVWPTTGPVGAWVEQAAWESDPTPPTVYLPEVSETTTHNVTADADDYEPSWDLAQLAAAGGAPLGTLVHRSVAVTPTGGTLITGSGATQQQLTSLSPNIVTTGVTTTAGILAAEGADWQAVNPISDDLVDGVDYSRPPAEVALDDAVNSQVIGTGSTGWGAASYSWDVSGSNPQGTIDILATSTDDVTVVSVEIGPGDVKFDVTLTIGGGAGTPVGTGSASLPTTARYIVVAATHSYLDHAEDWPGTTGGVLGGPVYGLDGAVTVGTDEAPLTTWAVMPAYRVWVPSASPVDVVRVLRHGTRNDGRKSTAPRRWGQESSYQAGRSGGYI